MSSEMALSNGEMVNIALMTDQTRFDERAGESVAPDARPFDLLISRARRGDLTAFDQIILAHQQRVIGLAWRMLGNQEDARDAAQETFLRVYKHLNKFDPAQDFAAWLYRIAVNVCRDLARKRGRGNPTSLEAEREAGTMAEPVSPHNTEHSAIHAQERDIVLRALATLTEKERAAIVLRDLEGLPTEEVARILGSTPTTVRSQTCTARVKIKQFREHWLKSRISTGSGSDQVLSPRK
jgi:RNA polymerase sigma-70 factor (ECF subfamily)